MVHLSRKYAISLLSDAAASRLAEYEGRCAAGAPATPSDIQAMLDGYAADERRTLAFHFALMFIRFYPHTLPDDFKAVMNEDERCIVDEAFAVSVDSLPRIPGYRIHGRLSNQGDQSIVYEATEELAGRKVAIKVPRDRLHAGSVERRRFLEEIQALAALDHPNIVPIRYAGNVGTLHYFVMPLIEGTRLDDYLAMPACRNSHLELFLTIAQAVSKAHDRGMIHGDLKPANVLIDQFGEPHILDFGLARSLADSSAADAGTFMGSLPWSAPEQVKRQPDKIDTRTDVYALGVMLFHAITGMYPYPITGDRNTIEKHIVGSTPAFCVVRINAGIEAIITKALAKDPEDRYQSAGELGEDIQRFFDNEPLVANVNKPGYPRFRYTQRRFGLVELMLVVGVLAIFVYPWVSKLKRITSLEAQVQRLETFAHTSLLHACELSGPDQRGADALFELASYMSENGKYDCAERLLRQVKRISAVAEASEQSGLWTERDKKASALLITVLTNQRKFAEAEVMILEDYNRPTHGDHAGFVCRHDERVALTRIVSFYKEWLAAQPNESRAVELSGWRDKLAAYAP